MKIFLFNLFLISVSLLFSNIAQAEIYKCKDKEGIINFTSVPCGQKSVGIKRPQKKLELNEDGTKKTRQQLHEEKLKREKEFLETAQREREARKKKQEKLEQHQKKLKQNCERAKNDLLRYQRSNYLYNKSKDGKNRILSDAERQKAELDAKRRISFWCRE